MEGRLSMSFIAGRISLWVHICILSAGLVILWITMLLCLQFVTHCPPHRHRGTSTVLVWFALYRCYLLFLGDRVFVICNSLVSHGFGGGWQLGKAVTQSSLRTESPFSPRSVFSLSLWSKLTPSSLDSQLSWWTRSLPCDVCATLKLSTLFAICKPSLKSCSGPYNIIISRSMSNLFLWTLDGFASFIPEMCSFAWFKFFQHFCKI